VISLTNGCKTPIIEHFIAPLPGSHQPVEKEVRQEKKTEGTARSQLSEIFFQLFEIIREGGAKLHLFPTHRMFK
jgi:hypothetical protein